MSTTQTDLPVDTRQVIFRLSQPGPDDPAVVCERVSTETALDTPGDRLIFGDTDEDIKRELNRRYPATLPGLSRVHHACARYGRQLEQLIVLAADDAMYVEGYDYGKITELAKLRYPLPVYVAQSSGLANDYWKWKEGDETGYYSVTTTAILSISCVSVRYRKRKKSAPPLPPPAWNDFKELLSAFGNETSKATYNNPVACHRMPNHQYNDTPIQHWRTLLGHLLSLLQTHEFLFGPGNYRYEPCFQQILIWWRDHRQPLLRYLARYDVKDGEKIRLVNWLTYHSRRRIPKARKLRPVVVGSIMDRYGQGFDCRKERKLPYYKQRKKLHQLWHGIPQDVPVLTGDVPVRKYHRKPKI